MPEKNETPKLSPALEGKYELQDYQPGPMEISGFGLVDMTRITLAMADRIHESGNCPHLVKVESKPSKTANS